MRRFVDEAVFRAAEVAVATLEGWVCNGYCCCTDSVSAAPGGPRAIGALPAGGESLLPPLAPDERPIGPEAGGEERCFSFACPGDGEEELHQIGGDYARKVSLAAQPARRMHYGVQAADATGLSTAHTISHSATCKEECPSTSWQPRHPKPDRCNSMLRQDLALVSSPEEWDAGGPWSTLAAPGLTQHAGAGALEQDALSGEGLLQAASSCSGRACAPLVATLAQGCRSCEAGVRAAARGALPGRCALDGPPPEARTRSRPSRDDVGVVDRLLPSPLLSRTLAGMSLLDLHESSRAGIHGATPRGGLGPREALETDHLDARPRSLHGSPQFGDDRDICFRPLELWPTQRHDRAVTRARAHSTAAGGEASAPRRETRSPSPGRAAVAADLLHWLERFRLQQHRDAALEWCVEMGASSTGELADHVEEFADALGLKPLERDRARRWAQQERAHASLLARPSGGPDLKTWDGANSRIAREATGELEHEDTFSDADDTNLLQASLVSMSRAVQALGPPAMPDAPELRRQGAHTDLEEVGRALRRQSASLNLDEIERTSPLQFAPRSSSV